MENDVTGARATLHLAVFSTKSFKLQVIDQPEPNSVDFAETMKRERCLAGANGGYFTPEFAPIGLRIRQGRTTSRLVRAGLLTGILASGPRGVEIIRPPDFLRGRKTDAAIQCGPNLVDGSRAIRGLNNTKAARRTFAATISGGKAALGYCSSVTLAELAEVLSTTPLIEGAKVQRALNLDGGSSSAFWFKREDGSALSIREHKPVRDFIGVVPR